MTTVYINGKKVSKEDLKDIRIQSEDVIRKLVNAVRKDAGV